jgi:hypothetical protein
MGFIKRLLRGNGAGGRGPRVDQTLDDGPWYAASIAEYERTVGSHYGSPETMAGGGFKAAHAGDSGVAMQFFRKSIDMLHSAHGFNQMSTRQPSPSDGEIVDGFCAALEQSLRDHPSAPVDEAVREVTHRLRSITTTCEQAGMPSEPYQLGLDRLAVAAPAVQTDDIRWT